jgi:hypothetical protein
MKAIPLVGGGCTWVDDEDFELLANRVWRLWESPSGGPWRYAISGDGKPVKMHREIMVAPALMLVDHVDGNGLNNFRSNLRIVTHSQNQQNTTSSKNQKLGGYKGVHWSTPHGKWQAQIRIPNPSGVGRGKRKALGRYDDPVEAALAYDAASRKYHTHGCLNFPLRTK